MHRRLIGICAGTLAGLAATLPMSVVMLLGRRHGVSNRLEPLPPRQITERALEAIGLDRHLSKESEQTLTVVNHFGYGAAMGATYGVVIDPPLGTTRAIATGVVYGLGVWTISYLGWLPATGFYRSASKDSCERNLMMLGAHVVWGGSLGLLTELAKRAAIQRETESVARADEHQQAASASFALPKI